MQGTALSRVSGPLYACPQDEDWYLVGMTPGDTLPAEIRFDGAAVDLDLYVFAPQTARPADWSTSHDSSIERATFVSQSEGTAVILVVPYGTGEGAYELVANVAVGEGPMCAPPGGSCRSAGDCCSGFCHIDHCH